MKRTLRKVGIAVAIVVLILILLPFVLNVNSFRPMLESELSAAAGRQIQVGNLSLAVFSGSVGADDIVIADDPAFSKTPFVRAKALKISVELMPLIFSRTLHVTGLTLDEPEIVLLRSPSGTWNFSTLGGKSAVGLSTSSKAAAGGSASTNLSVARLNVNHGRVSVGRTNSTARPQVFDDVNIRVRDFSAVGQFPFTMSTGLPGGGRLTLDGKAGPLDARDVALTPVQTKIAAKDLNLAASGFVDPSAGIAGLADFDGTLTSEGRLAQVKGLLTANKLKLAAKGTPADRPIAFNCIIDHDRKKEGGVLKQGDVSVGKATAHLTGTYQSQPESTHVNMKLEGENMPVDELEVLLPSLGMVLPSGSSLKGGTLSLNLGITGPIDRLTITGPIRLADTRLAGFDLGSKLSAISALVGVRTGTNDTLLQNLSTNLSAAPDAIRTESINLTVPAIGELTGNGTVRPGGALDYKMVAMLKSGLLGKGGIPFLIRGTTANPSFAPDVGGIAEGTLKNIMTKDAAGESSLEKGLKGLFGKKK